MQVVKCYKTLIQYKYFIRCYGGFLCLGLILMQSICVIIVIKKSLNNIKINIYNILRTFTHFGLIKSKTIKNFPPIKKPKTSKSLSLINSSNNINSSKCESKISLKKKTFRFHSKKRLSNLKKNNNKMITVNERKHLVKCKEVKSNKKDSKSKKYD